MPPAAQGCGASKNAVAYEQALKEGSLRQSADYANAPAAPAEVDSVIEEPGMPEKLDGVSTGTELTLIKDAMAAPRGLAAEEAPETAPEEPGMLEKLKSSISEMFTPITELKCAPTRSAGRIARTRRLRLRRRRSRPTRRPRLR